MKRFISLLNKVKDVIGKEYLIYTGAFFAMMMILYLYLIFAGMAEAPKFTYAEF